MTQRTQQELRAEAIAWHIRQRDDATADWDAFVLWLEQNPAHAGAYETVARADAAIEASAVPLQGQAMPAIDDEEYQPSVPARGSWGRRWVTGLAAVATLVLIVLTTLPLLRGSGRYEIATAPGQHRTVDLGDGSSAILNGGTRLILDRHHPRSVELAAGEATFIVHHDASRRFIVTAGEYSVEDVGTQFNLIHEPGRFEVAVIEGSVLYDPDSVRVRLTAGEELTVRAGSRPLLGRADPATFAGWRRGRLSYTSTPLVAVASDLSRNVGVDVQVAPDVRALRFTGTIRIERDAGATIANFAATLGLRARRAGNGWLIGRYGSAHR